jgi:hypothetical protein
MNSRPSRASALLAGALILACTAAVHPPEGEGTVTLGTFDSRAVAIAYAGSEAFGSYMSGLMQELDDAKRAGDTARVAELEAFGPELQARLHRQGFSTGAVDDILEQIEDQIPAIARAAGVDVLVSKWDLVWQEPDAALHDVTWSLVEAFDPDERTRTSCREIMAQDPVPEADLGHEH